MPEKVRLIGDPVLEAKARVVRHPSNSDIQLLIRDLKATMLESNLVGLAAPQIGVGLRVFVAEVRADNSRGEKEQPFTAFINPVLRLSGAKSLEYEGCGSIPELFGNVPRSEHLTITYHDPAGETQTERYEGFMARVIQHETDHLDGIMFTERADPKSLMWEPHYQRRILGIEPT